MVDHPRRAIFELAHALVEQPDQVGEPVGHGRIDRVADRPLVAALHARALGGPAVIGVGRLRPRDHLGENVDLVLGAGAGAEQHVDHFLEIEQPERQPQIARIEHERLVAEQAAILVVGVEHEDPQVRARPQDLLQHQHHRARFPDAGGPEHGEVLAQHVVDVDIGADRAVLLEMPDLDHGCACDVEDQPQLARAHRKHRIADRRIFGDAALELGGRRRRLFDLAHQIDVGRGMAAELLGERRRLDRDLGDDADEQRLPRTDAEKLADRGSRLVAAIERRAQQAYGRLRTTHGDDAADRLLGVRRRVAMLTQPIDLQHSPLCKTIGNLM